MLGRTGPSGNKYFEQYAEILLHHPISVTPKDKAPAVLAPKFPTCPVGLVCGQVVAVGTVTARITARLASIRRAGSLS